MVLRSASGVWARCGVGWAVDRRGIVSSSCALFLYFSLPLPRLSPVSYASHLVCELMFDRFLSGLVSFLVHTHRAWLPAASYTRQMAENPLSLPYCHIALYLRHLSWCHLSLSRARALSSFVPSFLLSLLRRRRTRAHTPACCARCRCTVAPSRLCVSCRRRPPPPPPDDRFSNVMPMVSLATGRSARAGARRRLR